MFFLLSLLIAAVLGQVYNCTKITDSTTCINAGYCYWVGTTCVLDQCLKYVSDDDYNTATDSSTLCTAAANGPGSVCKLYYLTGVQDCTTTGCPESSATDLYCRETNPAYLHSIIDKCFFDDLKNRAANPETTSPYLPSSNCKANNTNDIGWYVYTADVQDCSLATTQELYCDCLGVTWCTLHPACTLSSDKKSCGVDPCNQYSNKTSQSPACGGGAPGTCTGITKQYVSDNNQITYQGLCVTTATNKDANECFYAYRASESPNSNCADVRQCNTITKYDACNTAVQHDENGAALPDSKCHLETIPGGYFVSNSYCSDGRSLPSFGAAHHVKITSFVLLLAVIVLAIL